MLRQRYVSPLLTVLALAYFALMNVGGSNVRVAFHVPHESASAVAFVAQNSWAIRLGSFSEFVSAIPLGIFMAIILARLQSSGARSSGVQIAALGAIATPMMIAGSALSTWSLTRPGVAAAPGAVEALQSLGFDGGGPGFAIFLGLFVAGVSLAKRLPWWLTGLGVVVAAAGELSSLTLLNFTAGYCIPVIRFLSIFWMLALAFKFPADPSLAEDAGDRLAAAPIP